VKSFNGSPFDDVGPLYDQSLGVHPFDRDLRAVVQKTLTESFPAGSHILDLGCGTATDAVMLAEHGVRVTGVDSSPGMLDCARKKVSERRLGHSISLINLDIESIDSLNGTVYDGAYSNFGVLNCLADLRTVIGQIARVIAPGSRFVVSVLNRVCVWEIAGFLARGKISSAFRRLRFGMVHAQIGRASLPVWYYSPGEFGKMLSPWFRIRQVYGLSILSPTLNAKQFASSHPLATGRLQRMDHAIRGVFPFRSLGDHFVMVAERRTP
jgi:ubiquinone/menaquinone biosynthesis C-methylase UbiE